MIAIGKNMPESSNLGHLPSISAIIACYLDVQAVPEMHERLTQVFRKIGCDYELVFVNDASPDGTFEELLKISRVDPKVVVVNHSRNFGSQMAFKSGMEVSSKDAVLLMDGDLQDPPETVADLYNKFLEGFDVVYGVREKREMTWVSGALYKLFYRLYSGVSDFNIPIDAGDFSIISRRVVLSLLQFRERDLFLRGLRAYVGFSQAGVPYFRPKRKFGESTNNLSKNVRWARMAIFSVTTRPLTIMTDVGFVLFGSSLLVGFALTISRLFFDNDPVPGITMLALFIAGFGGINLLALGIIGEYVAKIVQEVKARPAPIRESIWVSGESIKF